MLKNMQNKDNKGNKQEVTHTELKFPRSQQKQKRPKRNERNVVSSEQQARHKELKSRRFFLCQYRKWLFRKKRKVSHHRSTKWQVLAWSLGILCVVLMITLRVLLANLFSNREDQNQKISTIPTLSSKNSECSCDHCSTHWIGFGSSYYHLSSKTKTWMESHAACEELNTHLLKMDIKGELIGETFLLLFICSLVLCLALGEVVLCKRRPVGPAADPSGHRSHVLQR
ncbi:killer cell lectin-like receptor subfamily I member 1 [Oryx dammah]|uniref:killer cell lectin-like receptor subfamily I member 1 n=1 Tax=Oryx dammah TaxID=59534 RepID=UPI001A9A7470|nr:killer cell lectin-like receptor subfamily I member 1 [Oryx dammah]